MGGVFLCTRLTVGKWTSGGLCAPNWVGATARSGRPRSMPAARSQPTAVSAVSGFDRLSSGGAQRAVWKFCLSAGPMLLRIKAYDRIKFHNMSYANQRPPVDGPADSWLRAARPFMLVAAPAAGPTWPGFCGGGLPGDQSRVRLAVPSISVVVAEWAAENSAHRKGLPRRQTAPQQRIASAREHVPIPRMARGVGRTSEVEAEDSRIRGELTGGSFKCEPLADVKAPTRPRPYRNSFPV